MNTKEEVLQSLKELARQKAITKKEVLDALSETSSPELVPGKRATIAEILYYIGGAIVFFGVAILIFQNWSTLSAPTKILSTLGSGVVAYFVAILFNTRTKTEHVGWAFFLISALVMPLGLYVTFYEAGLDVDGNKMQSLISIILFAVYLSSFLFFRKNIFIIFSVIFGTWWFFSFTNLLTSGSPIWGSDFLYCRVLAVGLTYILFGYYFSNNNRSSLSGFLYGFGILGFLGAALALGGWKPSQKIFWELAFPGLVFATLFLSIHLKSKAFLTFGTIFLMAYISKITAEYFSGSLGWPLSLVIIGLLLIATGYLFVYLKNKYMSPST